VDGASNNDTSLKFFGMEIDPPRLH